MELALLDSMIVGNGGLVLAGNEQTGIIVLDARVYRMDRVFHSDTKGAGCEPPAKNKGTPRTNRNDRETHSIQRVGTKLISKQ